VLAGGAVSGGAFKVGGLKALDDYLVGRKISELDTYVGLSAGALLAVPLAGGVAPDEMLRVLDGTSEDFDQLRPIDFYNPNLREYFGNPAKLTRDVLSYLPMVGYDLAHGLPGLPGAVGPKLRALWRKPSYTHFENAAISLLEHVSPRRAMPVPTDFLPSGLFDNVGLERWLRLSLERFDLPNEFRAFARKTGRKLYIAACNLDSAERVIFGPDEMTNLSISQAVQASSALPLFYKPARFGDTDYVDGGVRNTANIDVAIEKGADLVICYNPFRPFMNRLADEDGKPVFAAGKRLADRGMLAVLNQVFRTLLHSRLKLGVQRYLTDDRFQGDIVLLEPREEDASFFGLNPIAFWKRAEAAAHGFESVRGTIEQHYDELSALFADWGLEMDRGAARRRAGRARDEHGWAREPERDSAAENGASPAIRLVTDPEVDGTAA
jgi:predicted acylesterase/phospholipase RssA